MDLGLPGLDGIEATRRIRAARSLTQVVILSMHDEPDRVERALRAGASGYVLKGQGIRSLCDAIRSARRGESYLSEELRGYVGHGGGRPGEGPGRDAGGDGLSDREREVLALIADGLTSREIAERLALRPKTIENHRARIMDKLEIHTTAGLVRYALRGRS
jgi:DNA-binding NarL/FixJ family response regulator